MTLLHSSEATSKCQTHQAEGSGRNSFCVTSLWQRVILLSCLPWCWVAPMKADRLTSDVVVHCHTNWLNNWCLFRLGSWNSTG